MIAQKYHSIIKYIRTNTCPLVLLIVLQLCCPLTTKSQQNDLELNEILQGFDGIKTDDQTPVVNDIVYSDINQISTGKFPSISLNGSICQLIAYAPYGHTTTSGHFIHALSNIKSRIALTAKISFSEDWITQVAVWAYYDFIYKIKGYSHYSTETVAANEKETTLGETYLQGRLSKFIDISFGRRVEILGKSDFFRISDVINPADSRDRLLNDIEITHLPLLMTKIDAYLNNWRISALLSHEFRYDKKPVYGSDFFPFDFPAPPRKIINNDIKNCTFSLAAAHDFSGYDLDFFFASYKKELDEVGLTRDTPERYATRLTMFGAAMEKAVGSQLYKVEVAAKKGMEFYGITDKNISGIDLLLGADYTGLNNTRLSFEIHDRHLFYHKEDDAETDDIPTRDELIWAFRLSRSFMRNTCNLVFLTYVGGFDFCQGSVQNLSFRYNVNDNITVSSGYIFVNSGNNFYMKNVGKNDRAYIKLKYTF